MISHIRMHHMYHIHLYFANVVDPMHTILLNVTKNLISEGFYEKDASGKSREPRFNFDRKEFMERVVRYPWTAEQRAGRVPCTANMKKTHLGYWKGGFIEETYSHPDY